MRPHGAGSHHLQPACVGDGPSFVVEVEQDFHVIRNEADRDHDDMGLPAPSGELT